jgi:hypothetical protein
MEPETQELPQPRVPQARRAMEPRPAPEPQVEAPPSQTVSIPFEQFQVFMQTLLTESRKPPIDEMKERQKARMKAQNRSSIKDKEKFLLQKFYNCSHMQRPGSILTGCSAVAWATQSDALVRGSCQHCGSLFSPRLEECIPCHPDVHAAYKELIRIPTHPAGNVRFDWQHA